MHLKRGPLLFGAIAQAVLLIVPAQAKAPRLTKDEAQVIALKLHPGKVKSGELEKERGVQLYSFDIETKDGIHEVGVDANSGKIVEDSMESVADEAKEKRADKPSSK